VLLFGKTTAILPREDKAMGKAMAKLGWENRQLNFMGKKPTHYVKGNGDRRLATHISESGRLSLVEEPTIHRPTVPKPNTAEKVIAGTHPMQGLIDDLISEALAARGLGGLDLSDFAAE
jgi:hypothetical protein